MNEPVGLPGVPGISVALLMVVPLPTVPVPRSVPPEFTVTVLAIDPSTSNVPPLTVVAPV